MVIKFEYAADIPAIVTMIIDIKIPFYTNRIGKIRIELPIIELINAPIDLKF